MIDGIAVFVSLCLLFAWIGSKGRHLCARYGFFTDIAVHGTCQLLLGGANQGRIAVLFGCLMFSCFMLFYRRIRSNAIRSIT